MIGFIEMVMKYGDSQKPDIEKVNYIKNDAFKNTYSFRGMIFFSHPINVIQAVPTKCLIIGLSK